MARKSDFRYSDMVWQSGHVRKVPNSKVASEKILANVGLLDFSSSFGRALAREPDEMSTRLTELRSALGSFGTH